MPCLQTLILMFLVEMKLNLCQLLQWSCAFKCEHLSLYHLTFFPNGGQKIKQQPKHLCTIDFKWIFHSLHLSTSMWQTLKNKEIKVAWFYLFMSPAGDYKYTWSTSKLSMYYFYENLSCKWDIGIEPYKSPELFHYWHVLQSLCIIG